MPNLTDARFEALRVLVPAAPPTTNDMLRAYLLANGGSGNHLNDLWRSFFLANGATPGHHNDMARQFLDGQGFTQPHLNDAWLAFWLAGGGLGGGAGFVSLRSVGTRYDSSNDGVGPFALAKPAGYQVGDLLVVVQVGTFFSGTHPVENPGPWTQVVPTANHIFSWRIATGDANDDYTVNTVAATSAHYAIMQAYDLSNGPYTSISPVAGFNLAGNDSSYTTQYPVPGAAQFNNDQTLSIAWSMKSDNINHPATGLVDNWTADLLALPSTTDGGLIDSYFWDGQGGNPAAARSSWVTVHYVISDGNPADAILFQADRQTEQPNSSGFEVMNFYGQRLRITL